MNIIGALLIVVMMGLFSTVFNRTVFADKNWKDGEPCLVSTPTGVIQADRCYGSHNN